MDNFMAARSQMALSLGFHIIFSCIGMVMPFFMAVSHFLWLRTGNPVYQNVTKAWSKAWPFSLRRARYRAPYYPLSLGYFGQPL
jgi:cytochrome bd-type quinol oxidase subunit 1